MLLNVGPRSDGSIPDEAARVLLDLGRWTNKHAEAIYGTVAGLPHGHFYGASTLNKARDTLYLICFDFPNEAVAVKGIRNRILRSSIVGKEVVSSRTVGGAPWANLPGVLWVDVPEHCFDCDATVIKLELDGPLDLYQGTRRCDHAQLISAGTALDLLDVVSS